MMSALLDFFSFFLFFLFLIIGHAFLGSEIKHEEAAVLHYTYPKFSDLTSRRNRCGCKPTKVDVKKCIMLDFDRAVSVFTICWSILLNIIITVIIASC